MQRRVSTAIGTLAGAVAVVTIVVFGYLSMVTPLRPGPRGASTGKGKGKAAAGGGLAMVRPEHLVDRDYLFRLDAPNSSWRLFDHLEADRGWPNTNAIMLSDDSVAEVQVTRVGDVPLDRADAAVVSWRGKPASSQRVSWLGLDAIEYQFGDDTSANFERAFMRDGYLYTYTLVPFGKVAMTEADREPLWNALTLVPGQVKPGDFDPAPRDVRGERWRVESGRWESADVELAIEPPPGWRLLVGRDLWRSGSDVDVLMKNTATGCYVGLSIAADMVAGNRVGQAVLTAEIAGESRDLVEVAPSAVSRKWQGQLASNGYHVVVHAWGPERDGDQALASLRVGLAAIRRTTAAERIAVVTDLAAAPYHPTAVGASWVDRDGTFADYASGLVFARTPQPPWMLFTGDAAVATLPGASVAGIDAPNDVTFAISVDPTVATTRPPAKWLKQSYGLTARAVDLSALHGAIHRAAEARWRYDKIDYVHQTAALVDERGHALRIDVWGRRASVAAAQPALAVAIGGAVVTDVTAATDDAGVHLDRRWGFAMSLPGWSHTTRTDGVEFTDQTWETATGLIGITVDIGPSATDKATIVRARNLASANVAAGFDYQAKSSRTTIGGEPAVRLTWLEGSTVVTVILVEHDELVYTLYSRGDQSTVHELETGFRFVDNPASDT